MKHTFGKIVLASLMLAVMPMPAAAEETRDFSDTVYWNELCTKESTLSTAQRNACTAFMEYMEQESTSLTQRIKEIDAKKAEIAENILEYARQVQNYQTQANALNGEISALSAEISELTGDILIREKKIEESEAEITVKEGQISDANEKVRERIENAQGTMRLNQYLDIMMGASSFEELIRIVNGIADILAHDSETIQNLSEDVSELTQAKIELQEEKDALQEKKSEVEVKKKTLVNKQNDLLALSYQAQVIEDEFRKQKVDLEAEGNRIAGDIEEIKAKMKEISEHLSEVVAANGFTFPVKGGSLSTGGGTWHYAASFGGGVHLGNDIQCRLGSEAVAIGNGVVLKTADGCEYGYLGNGCGVANGGTWGGGNQLYLLVKINGSLYACKYIHLLKGSFVVQKGDIVTAGQKLAQTGSSGNSTGPHCHFEIYYLGDASNFASYAQNWNGDMAFGCGWGSAALNNTCDRNGNKAPCRVRPEDIYGG